MKTTDVLAITALIALFIIMVATMMWASDETEDGTQESYHCAARWVSVFVTCLLPIMILLYYYGTETITVFHMPFGG